MKQFLIIFAIGLTLGTVLGYFLFKEICTPADPEIIVQEVPVPEPYPVSVPVPTPVKVDTASIWEAALASVDKTPEFIYHEVDTAAILSQIDTTEILKDYYSTYHYDQTISDDSTFAVDLHQEISRNRIMDQSAVFRPLKKEIQYIQQPVASNYIFVGGMISTGSSPGIAPMINYVNDRGNYGVGYDLNNKSVVIQAQLKIFSWH